MPPKKSAKSDNSDVDAAAPKKRAAKQFTMLEHAKKKTMWAGSQEMQKLETYVLRQNMFVLEQVEYPPALLKIIDEVIVNAIDHHTHYPKLVTEIKINLDQQGVIEVYNNGPGIPVEEVKNINGLIMYTPQLIASEFLAGDNLDDEANIKGGTNGVGLKLANAFSKWLKLETYDAERKLHYEQLFENELEKVNPPIITPGKKTSKPFTRITFLPVYEKFSAHGKNPLEPSNKFHKTLEDILRTRCWQAAAYISCDKTPTSIEYQGELVPVESFEQFAGMFASGEIKMFKVKGEKYTWHIGFAISDGGAKHISIVNGVYIPAGGTHVNFVQSKLVENLKPMVEKLLKKTETKFNKNFILNNTMIFICGIIESPSFVSQTKDAISTDQAKFAQYDLPATAWKQVWALLEPVVQASFLRKQLGTESKRTNRSKITADKYREADWARDAKKCHECGLILTEGDSATGNADAGLKCKISDTFNYTRFGVYSLQGVIVNTLKNSSEIVKTRDDLSIKRKSVAKKTRLKRGDTPGGQDASRKAQHTEEDDDESFDSSEPVYSLDDLSIPVQRVPNRKVTDNERLATLIKILGLDFNKTYALNEIGNKEWQTLRYGFIVGLMDQDLDGFNIFGLLATFILAYWPDLAKRNFIRRIITPVVRAYPKNPKKGVVKEFYAEHEAHEFIESLGLEKFNKEYRELQYYKGLGSHDPKKGEVKQLFKNIQQKICTYIIDENALATMHIYYGKAVSNRKIALKTPVKEIKREALTTRMPLSLHFEIDTKAYQRDNIIRKLLSRVDGFVSSRRKIFYTARKHPTTRFKVQGLAGKVVADADYHHGESSLEDAIVRMAQSFPYARNLPLLEPEGNFGSLSMGFKDYAQSRYIFTKYNNKLSDKIFRREDDYILKYELNDGNRYEPIYYCPIIPYVLMETNILPATGWKIEVYSRDFVSVLKNVRSMIMGKITKCKPLPYWFKDFKGDIRVYEGKQYFCGKYEYNQKTHELRILELPPDTYPEAYLVGSKKSKTKEAGEKKKCKRNPISQKEYVLDYADNSTDQQIDILLKLKPETLSELSSDESKYGNEVFDPFEEYFELKSVIHNHINLVDENGEVVEYASYEDVFNDWFSYRKELYTTRVDREIILKNLERELLLEIQRFSREHDSYKITNKTTEEQFIALMTKNKYKIFNDTLLYNPKFTDLASLYDQITKAEYGASYNYLFNLRYRELQEAAYKKREEELAKIDERLNYLQDSQGMFKGAKIWLHELDELEEIVKKGIETSWTYGELNYTFE